MGESVFPACALLRNVCTANIWKFEYMLICICGKADIYNRLALRDVIELEKARALGPILAVDTIPRVPNEPV